MTYCAISGTLLTMGFMQLFDTRLFAILSGGSLAAFAIYGLGLSVVQGLPVTPNIKLTTISRYMNMDHLGLFRGDISRWTRLFRVNTHQANRTYEPRRIIFRSFKTVDFCAVMPGDIPFRGWRVL